MTTRKRSGGLRQKIIKELDNLIAVSVFTNDINYPAHADSILQIFYQWAQEKGLGKIVECPNHTLGCANNCRGFPDNCNYDDQDCRQLVPIIAADFGLSELK